MNSWLPQVGQGATPLYERLADAIERDIRDGNLAPGARLPPHRELARELDISVGTVTKAYGEAERRGLLSGQVGRGSFVTSRASASLGIGHSDRPLNLALNVPPVEAAARHLADALQRLRRRVDLIAALNYALPEGHEAVRIAGADWLRRRHAIEHAAPNDVMQTNGGQHGLALVFGALVQTSETVLCEAVTFHGLKTLAGVSGYRLHGVAIDTDGLVPSALEQAITETKARVLYTVPTLHNPTTITMSVTRRRAIAEVARRHDLSIIEDDAYRAFADVDHRPPGLVDLAPERTFYIASLSKSLAPGLRLGFIRPPSRWRERLITRIRATGYAPPSLSGLVFAQWMETGAADEIADHILDDMRLRTDLARRILAGSMAPVPAPQTLHAWLPMAPLEAERTAGRALRAGVEVTPPDAPIVGGGVSGIRLCLGGVADLDTLRVALTTVAKALCAEVSQQSKAIV